MKKLFLFISIFTSLLYGYSTSMIQNCNEGYIKSCFALMWQAVDSKDKQSVQTYQDKILGFLDNSCKKDYQICLFLANVYAEKNSSQITQIIQRNTAQQNISKAEFGESFYDDSLSSMKDSLEIKDTSKITQYSLANPNQTKSSQYQERAIPLLESACFNDDFRACIILSYFYEYGVVTAQNRPKAKRLLELALDSATKQCMLENNAACSIIDKYPDYLAEIAKDVGKLERKCDDGDSVACFRTTLYYTQDYYIGSHQDTESDFVKSARFLQKACYLEKKACEATIFQHKNAKECLQDNNMNACANVEGSQKIEFLFLACNSGNLQSCYTLRHLSIFKDTKRYIKLLQRICRGGVIESCTELADMYYNGKGVAKDEERAFGFAKRACVWSMKTQAEGRYCYYAGIDSEEGRYVKQNIAQAMDFYRYACQNSQDGNPCQKLGNLYETYARNAQEAFIWYQQACQKEISQAQSCVKVAQSYESGKIVQQDREKAREIYETLLSQNIQNKGEIYFALANLYAQPQFYNQKTQISQKNEFLNYAQALQYYHQACSMNVESACSPNIQYPNLVEQCKALDFESCYQIASLLELLQQDSTLNTYKNKLDISESTLQEFQVKNQNIITSLYMQSCKNNIAKACLKVATQPNIIQLHDKQLLESICRYSKEIKQTEQICIHVAKTAISEDKYQKAIELLQGFSNKNSEILNLLAYSYFEVKNYQKVFETYQILYKNKLTSDYYYLGFMYENGLYVRQDSKRAFDIYTLSHSPLGYFGQARLYENGLGVSQNIDTAYKFYKLACPLNATQKEEIVENACLKVGEKLKQNNDLIEAHKYFTKVCEFGYDGYDYTCKK